MPARHRIHTCLPGLILLAGSAFIAACRPLPEMPAVPSPTLPASPARSATPEPSSLQLDPTASPFLPQATATAPQYSPTPPPSPTNPPPRRSHYDLQVEFDYLQHTLKVQQALAYLNDSLDTLDALVLVVDANKDPGVFALEALTWGDGQPVEGFSLEKTTLTLPLETPLAPGGILLLDLSFTLTLPPRPGALGYTHRQTLLMDWYPYAPPYQPGSGWAVHRVWPFGEYLAYESADIDVRLQLTGEMPPDELVLAAGAPIQRAGSEVRFRLQAARSAAWSASPFYQVTAVETESGPVQVYSMPEHAAWGERLAQVAGEALGLFSEQFGPYPYPSLTLVEADFADGREYDGLIFLSREYHNEFDGTAQNFLTLLAVHEIAHQWWFGLVGNDQALEPWLDESLSTYSESLYYERYHPQLVDWWWFFRINFFNPQGRINLPLYDFGSFRPYWHAVYMRGALFLRDLRAQMGDEAFFAFLRDYAAANAHQQATALDFFGRLADHSPADSGPLVQSYFDPAYLAERE